MESPPAFKLPPAPHLPLYPLSPERVNASTHPLYTATGSPTKSASKTTSTTTYTGSPRSSPSKRSLFADYTLDNPSTPSKSTSGFALPQSPSLPEIHELRKHGAGHARTNSDVQGLVARFNHLDVKDRDEESVERRRKHEAELRRAQIGREEAESDVRRLREETRRLKREGEEVRERERRVIKRVETLMEEYARAKEGHASQAVVYSVELRKARKEAFKSSSAVVKLQEELKSTRNSLRITQSGLDLSKQKIQQREQEAFDAQFQLVGVQEEVERTRQQLQIVQEEKEALKTSLKEEEVARIAAEGMIALPSAKDEDDDDLWSSPRKAPRKRSPSPLSDDKENLPVPRKGMESKILEHELRWERARREQAEDMVEFLRLECRFRCCDCKHAEKHGLELVSESLYAHEAEMDRIKAGIASVLAVHEDVREQEKMDVDSVTATIGEAEMEGDITIKPEAVEEVEMTDIPAAAEDEVVAEDDIRVTMAADEPQSQQSLAATLLQEEEPMAPHPTPTPGPNTDNADDATAAYEAPPPHSPVRIPLQLATPQTPSALEHHIHSVRTVTTTTTVPMHFTPSAKPAPLNLNLHFPTAEGSDKENIPDSTGEAGTFDRAAALAAIAYRRGRAKSIADGQLTPRKQMLEGVGVKERRDISAPALGGKVKGMGMGMGGGAATVGRAAGRRMV